jgi:radical SAM superfamily enzyme YgiQ (UPF0313 family)
VDCFWVGEAEAGLPDLLADLAGVWLEGGDKKEFLDRVKDRDGVWVPGASKTPVRRAVLPERELSRPAASCFLSSKAEFRDMLLLEINRGCPYACRFCAAGAVYRPPRRASTEKLKEVVERADPPKVGLVGTALTDWPDLLPFLRWLKERGTTFSLSSVRADGLTPELMEFLRKTGSRTLTLALEAPSKRLRTAAGKRLAEEDFLLAVERAAALRFNRLKIYLIVGWPGETGADYDELASFLDQVQAARDRGRGSRKSGLDLITLSLSPLVPKPWTPLQWAPMAPEAALSDRIKRIKTICKPLRGVRVEAETPFAARLQALLSRGDDRLFDLVELAVEKGGWRAAIKAWDGDPADYLRERDVNERLPWDVIDLGVSPVHLKRQWEAYHENKPGTVCPPAGCEACRRCGMEAWVQGAQE